MSEPAASSFFFLPSENMRRALPLSAVSRCRTAAGQCSTHVATFSDASENLAATTGSTLLSSFVALSIAL